MPRERTWCRDRPGPVERQGSAELRPHTVGSTAARRVVPPLVGQLKNTSIAPRRALARRIKARFHFPLNRRLPAGLQGERSDVGARRQRPHYFHQP